MIRSLLTKASGMFAEIAMRGGRATVISPDAVRQVEQTVGKPVRMYDQSGNSFDWFGPGTPLVPVAPKDVAGRALDYPVNYNVSQNPRAYEAISFGMLRATADAYDLLRLVIETRKDQIEAFGWNIMPKEGKTVSEKVIEEATAFFQSPDKEHMWCQWLRMLLEDLLVIDAVCVYPRLTRGGDLYSLELVDGGTIKRVLDNSGRTPLAEDGPAYQQVLHGLPAVDYTRDELIYSMRNPRTNRIYGYSPVEQVIMTVNIALRRQYSQLQYFTEGNIPEAIAAVPESWNLDTLKQFQIYWDTMLEGNTAQRRHMKFVPFDSSKIKEIRPEPLKDLFDEWLARIICYAFSIPPTSLIKEVNRSVAETSAATAEKEGLMPLLNYLKTLFTDVLLNKVYGNADIEFRWKLDKEIDPYVQAQTDQIYLQANVYDEDHVRERLGLPPLTEEQKAAIKEKNAPPQFGPDGKPLPPEEGGGKPPFGAKGKKPPFGKPAEKEEKAPATEKMEQHFHIQLPAAPVPAPAKRLKKTVTTPSGQQYIVEEEERA